MFHILGFLFFIILVVLVIGLLILSKIISMVFRFKRRMQGQHSGNRQDETFDSYSTQEDVPARPRKKIFDKDEGEYVEFEEIK